MYSHGHTSTDTLGDVMDQERREAISALGEDNLQALRDMTREALPEVDTTTRRGTVHEGPEQLCFAISTKTGTLVTRDGQPLWATRKLWERFPAVAQVIPIKGAPPIGSMALDSTHQPPDVVGQLIEQLDRLDRQTVEGAKAVQLLGTIAAKAAEGLENLSLIISQRIHFVELLDRAAAMIDPDRPEGTANYEARLDWLAKWREVIGR